MQITKIGMRGHILKLQSFPLNCILQPKQTPFKVLASLRNPLAQTESFARLIVHVHDQVTGAPAHELDHRFHEHVLPTAL